MKKITSLLLLGVFGLTGCAQNVSPQGAAQAQAPIYCENKQQCDAYWTKAKAWIEMNSGW
ncbi:hypothetical protein KFZ36_26525 [Salmonella enterica subsp. enterica serovar Typhimurium]|nr:hypothetical protein [Salmonella enterica subsp. enterica serovar Typhimurium]